MQNTNTVTVFNTVEIVAIEDGGYYRDEYTSGNTVNVTLRRGDVFASCEQILIFEDDAEALEEAFVEWVLMAEDGMDGYATWRA